MTSFWPRKIAKFLFQKPEFYIKEEPIEQNEGFDCYGSSDSENLDDDDSEEEEEDDDEDYGLPEHDISPKVFNKMQKMFTIWRKKIQIFLL